MATVAVGVDVVDVVRFTLALQRRPRMIDRLFTQREREDTAERPERLAARFAAKEAVLKTLGSGLGDASFQSIEVQRQKSGAPMIVLHDEAVGLARSRGITELHVSLSHTAATATAFVIGTSDVPRAS
ncbi:MAG: holo-ACP synthase [Acidimicrobiaceae bacterium]|nr:holo-ACP synthase [Acidimicrobiaceae bacterium]